MLNRGDRTLFWYELWAGSDVRLATWERDRLGSLSVFREKTLLPLPAPHALSCALEPTGDTSVSLNVSGMGAARADRRRAGRRGLPADRRLRGRRPPPAHRPATDSTYRSGGRAVRRCRRGSARTGSSWTSAASAPRTPACSRSTCATPEEPQTRVIRNSSAEKYYFPASELRKKASVDTLRAWTLTRRLDLGRDLRTRSVFLFGPRQTGKTTYLGQQFPESPRFNLLRGEVFLRLSARAGQATSSNLI